MAYDKNDLTITQIIQRGGSHGFKSVTLTAHNRSSISISQICVQYHILEGDVILSKQEKCTTDITPGEKRQILYEMRLNNCIDITKIIVRAADGTVFEGPPPVKQMDPNVKYVIIGLLIIVVIVAFLFGK